MFASCENVTLFFGETVHLSLDMGNVDFRRSVRMLDSSLCLRDELDWKAVLAVYVVSLASLESNYAGA
jgi:hypothetical protein